RTRVKAPRPFTMRRNRSGVELRPMLQYCDLGVKYSIRRPPMLDFLRLARPGVGLSAASVPSPAAPTLAQAPLAETGQPPGGGGWRSHVGSLIFLAPGGIWLAIIAGYPVVATIVRSFFDQSG